MTKFRLMLAFFLLFLINTGFINIHAQKRPPMPWRPNFRPANPMNKLTKEQRFKVLRGSGVVVIGAGTALFTASLNAIQKSNRYREENRYQGGNGLVDFGRAFGVFLGGVWIAGGTTMTIIANNKIDKLKRISLTNKGSSVGLLYHF